MGLWGNIVILIGTILLGFPVPMGTTPLVMCCGFLYGIVLGISTITVGSMIGACLSFIICRNYLRSYVESKIGGRSHLMLVMKSIKENSFKVIILIRSSPIPFGVQNALLAISRVDFGVYLAGSFIGLLPEQLILVYFGSSAHQLSDIFDGTMSGFHQLLLFLQIIICIVILLTLIWMGRKAIQDAIRESQIEKMKFGGESTHTI